MVALIHDIKLINFMFHEYMLNVRYLTHHGKLKEKGFNFLLTVAPSSLCIV